MGACSSFSVKALTAIDERTFKQMVKLVTDAYPNSVDICSADYETRLFTFGYEGTYGGLVDLQTLLMEWTGKTGVTLKVTIYDDETCRVVYKDGHEL